MKFSLPATILLLTVTGCAHLSPEQTQAMTRPFPYPSDLPGARVEIYKTVGDVDLQAYIFEPSKHRQGDNSAAIVFFFGGGWRQGSPNQFQPHAAYLASRGMVAIVADYRVSARHGVKAVECVRDAKSAIRWTRENAERLGIDPDRIVAAGGSAGGHLAACTGLIGDFDEGSEDTTISSVPNAMVLFNPALVLAPIDDIPFGAERVASLTNRMGVDPARLSPYHHIVKGAPPTIIFHGREDTTVPFATAQAFTEAMEDAGNRCVLIAYDNQGHGFFNYGRNENEMFRATTSEMHNFLQGLGYVQGPDRVERFVR